MSTAFDACLIFDSSIHDSMLLIGLSIYAYFQSVFLTLCVSTMIFSLVILMTFHPSIYSLLIGERYSIFIVLCVRFFFSICDWFYYFYNIMRIILQLILKGCRDCIFLAMFSIVSMTILLLWYHSFISL